jgi:hypothetical protein
MNQAKEIQGIKANGPKVEGEIIFLGEEVELNELTSLLAGKILGVGKVSKTTLAKIEALGAAGVVAVEMGDEVFAEACQGENWEIANESFCLKLPIMVIEKKDFYFLEENHGEKATLDPEQKKLVV